MPTRQRLSSLLGLALDANRLDAVVLRRTNGSLQVQQTVSAQLSLDPLTADPQLVAREIRNHLDTAGIHERHCVLALPLKWVLTTHAEIPQIPEADIASFLQIEAERGFPCDVSTLVTCTSRCRAASGKEYALMMGIPRAHLAVLDQVLRAAKLKPVAFGVGMIALAIPGSSAKKGCLALAISETNIGIQVSCEGGIAALRTLEGGLEAEGSRRVLNPQVAAREVRITLGQLPDALRDSVRQIRVFGPRDLGQQLVDELELRLDSLGLKTELVTHYAGNEFGPQLPPETVVSPALALAAERLARNATQFDFLPPRVTAWQQMTRRYSSSRLRLAAAVGGGVVLLVALLFGFQQVQLISARSQWNRMSAKVKELEGIQAQIRQYRPWFDEGARGLTILRQLTLAFPEEGTVTAKTVEIRELNAVTCAGQARDNQSLLRTLDRLRSTSGVSDVKVTQIRGKSPIQFTFDFRWNEGGRSEN